MNYRGNLCYLLQLEITDPDFGLPDGASDPDEQACHHVAALGKTLLNQILRFPYRRIRVIVIECATDVEQLV